MLPFNNNLLDKSPVRKKTESQHTFNIKVGKYSERCEAEGIVFIPLVVDRFGGWHKDSLEISPSCRELWCEAMCVLLEDMRVLEVPEVLNLNQVR